MRSAGVLAFRALVMLFTLVAVPAIALFWKQVPTTVDKLLATCEQRFGVRLPRAGQMLASAEPQAERWPASLTEAPRFDSSGAGPPVMLDPGSAATGWAGDPARGAPPVASNHPYPTAQASYEAPLTQPADAAAPAGMQPVEPGGLKLAPAPATDRFTTIQLRLRELGATYYLLESWGAGSTQYRFHCRMAVAGNDRYFRQFEATAGEPLAAMADVLRQVEDWRAGRVP